MKPRIVTVLASELEPRGRLIVIVRQDMVGTEAARTVVVRVLGARLDTGFAAAQKLGTPALALDGRPPRGSLAVK